MRRSWLAHTPTLAAFAAMIIIGGGMAVGLDPYSVPPGQRLSAATAQAIDLPAPEDDADNDSYGDDVDQFEGNAMVRVQVDFVDGPAGTEPYLLLGTQDDQWRFGAGRELEWHRIVDSDPLDMKPGSKTWTENSVRTGIWHRSLDNDYTADKDPDASPVRIWPWITWMDVRDDKTDIVLELQAWSDEPGTDRLLASWTIDVGATNWTLNGEPTAALAGSVHSSGATTIALNVDRGTNIDQATAQELAAQWAPRIHFDSGEAFFPTDPALMEQFHGFVPREPDLRTWSRSFNNGRDGYRMLVADFDGDGLTDHDDVELLWDILRVGTDSDQVQVQVRKTTGDRVVIQYWLIYPYNFVVGQDGRDVATLAHAGDREFVQLIFASVKHAKLGTPESVSFSQHYGGIRIDNPDMDESPFTDGRLNVYPARGSHASYPAPGDDSRLRSTFAGYGDRFNGEGRVWEPEDYETVVLGGEPWQAGYKWGPVTRHHRELGSPGKPLLVHSFTYPWHEPIRWAQGLKDITSEEIPDLYGESP